MKKENSSSAVVSEANSAEASDPSTEASVQRHWHGVVKRRSFLKGLGIAGAALSAGGLLRADDNAQATPSRGKLSKGDAALLRFAAAAELIEVICGSNTTNWAESKAAIQPTSLRLATLMRICLNTSPTTRAMN